MGKVVGPIVELPNNHSCTFDSESLQWSYWVDHPPVRFYVRLGPDTPDVLFTTGSKRVMEFLHSHWRNLPTSPGEDDTDVWFRSYAPSEWAWDPP